METFSALLAICAGNSPVSGEFPAQKPVTRSFDVFFDVRVWVNTREAGHLRRYRIHYDVIVMVIALLVTAWMNSHIRQNINDDVINHPCSTLILKHISKRSTL